MIDLKRRQTAKVLINEELLVANWTLAGISIDMGLCLASNSSLAARAASAMNDWSAARQQRGAWLPLPFHSCSETQAVLTKKTIRGQFMRYYTP